MKLEKCYTFDDLMMVPRHSYVRSRKDPDTTVKVGIQLLNIPIISAPMNTVTESDMAKAMSSIGASGVIHRYMSVEKQCRMFEDSINWNEFETWVAVGASGDYLNRAKDLYKAGARLFCIDVANGHSEICIEAVQNLKQLFGNNISVMAGNVCTSEGAYNLDKAGADAIRCGIGGGSVCATRIVTGYGVPQLTAIKWCAEGVENAKVIADGGIRSSGDLCKALAMGADAVMLGGMLAGCNECPGDIFEENGVLYKHFRGMASKEGREDWFGKEASSYVPEGVALKAKLKGSVTELVHGLNDSLKVSMSFASALNLEEFKQKTNWIEVTDNGRKEGNPNKKMLFG